MKPIDPFEHIRGILPQEERLAQLAEECAELGKAALKYRRILDGRNPTPVSQYAAYENLIEEIADVALCLSICGFRWEDVQEECRPIMEKKLERWQHRLKEKQLRR